MKCPKCGNKIPDGLDDCPFCGIIISRYRMLSEKKEAPDLDDITSGERFSADPDTASDSNSGLISGSPVLKYLILAMIIIIAGKGFLFLKKSDKPPKKTVIEKKEEIRQVQVNPGEQYECYRFFIDMLSVSKVINTHLEKDFSRLDLAWETKYRYYHEKMAPKIRELNSLFNQLMYRVSYHDCTTGSKGFDSLNLVWGKMNEARNQADNMMSFINNPDFHAPGIRGRDKPDHVGMRNSRTDQGLRNRIHEFNTTWKESQDMLAACAAIFPR